MKTLSFSKNLGLMIMTALCGLILSGCSLPRLVRNYPTPAITATFQPSNTQVPSTQAPIPPTQTPIPPTQTSIPPAPTSVPPTPTNPPELPQNAATVQVGFMPGAIYYLTYDISLWEAVPDPREPGAYRLVSLVFPGCEMYQLLGHGMDPARHKANESVEVIGQTTFILTDWIDIPSGKSILYSYAWGPDQLYALEVAPGEQDQDCITLSRQVVALSETQAFLQP